MSQSEHWLVCRNLGALDGSRNRDVLAVRNILTLNVFHFVCQDEAPWVRQSHELSEGEIKATRKRREKVLMCLETLGIRCEQVSTDSPSKERR